MYCEHFYTIPIQIASRTELRFKPVKIILRIFWCGMRKNFQIEKCFCCERNVPATFSYGWCRKNCLMQIKIWSKWRKKTEIWREKIFKDFRTTEVWGGMPLPHFLGFPLYHPDTGKHTSIHHSCRDAQTMIYQGDIPSLIYTIRCVIVAGICFRMFVFVDALWYCNNFNLAKWISLQKFRYIKYKEAPPEKWGVWQFYEPDHSRIKNHGCIEIHEFMNTFSNFHEFTNDILSFYESRTKSLLPIHERFF